MGRRQLAQVAEAMHSDNIKSYICLCCARIRTNVRNWECAYDCWDKDRNERWESWETRTDIRMMSVKGSLWRMYNNNRDAFDDNFGMASF